eukprot:g26954.t1
MPTGLVTTWLEEKGFGFIAPDDSTFGDLFVHVSELRDARANGLERGDRVRFDVKYNREKGKNLAVNVIVEKSESEIETAELEADKAAAEADVVAVAAETADKMPDAGATAGVGVAGQQLTPCDCAVTVPASSFLAVLVISCDGSMEQSGGGATTPQAKVRRSPKGASARDFAFNL